MTVLLIIVGYLALLLGLGLFASRLFRGTSRDYMLASHSIGPFLLLMSLFGTTMTAFALVGSTGEAFKQGIGVYGMLASASGIMHSLCFFVVGIRLWGFGRRLGYKTQIQFFRDRLEDSSFGLILFPVLVALVIPYLLIGVLAAGTVINKGTIGAFANLGWFEGYEHAVPPWLASLVICVVVLIYVFFGGMRGTAWANTFQTLVFMFLGVLTFFTIARGLGGTESLLENLQTATDNAASSHLVREGLITKVKYASYLLIPLSVAMFPHVFQHWLTARSAKSFRLPIVAHPIFIMIVWLPCVLIGVWATGAGLPAKVNPNSVLAILVNMHANDVLAGLLTAGILAAIMSSLDSQFLCLGTMFTEDVVVFHSRANRLSDKQEVLVARSFVVAIVAITYLFSLFEPRAVFTLGVWCFSGFTGLFPLVVAALYWRRLTAAGAYASVLATAVSWGVLFYQSDFAKNAKFTVLGMHPVATIFACSTVALILVSLLTRPPSDATLAKFFPEKA